MTLIFLSTSEYFNVYLDIVLMGFHLSSPDWTGLEGREEERARETQLRQRERARERCVESQTESDGQQGDKTLKV